MDDYIEEKPPRSAFAEPLLSQRSAEDLIVPRSPNGRGTYYYYQHHRNNFTTTTTSFHQLPKRTPRPLYDQGRLKAYLPPVLVIIISALLVSAGVVLILPDYLPGFAASLGLNPNTAADVGYGLLALSVFLPLFSFGVCVTVATPSSAKRQRTDVFADALLEELVSGPSLAEHADVFEPAAPVMTSNNSYNTGGSSSGSSGGGVGSESPGVSSSSSSSGAHSSPPTSRSGMHRYRSNTNNNFNQSSDIGESNSSNSSSSSSTLKPVPTIGTIILLAGAGSPRVHSNPFAEAIAAASGAENYPSSSSSSKNNNNNGTRERGGGFRAVTVDLPGHGSLASVTFSLSRCERVISAIVERELSRAKLLLAAATATATGNKAVSDEEQNNSSSSSAAAALEIQANENEMSILTKHPSATKTVVIAAYGASTHVAAYYALRHPSQIAGLVFLGRIPDYATSNFQRSVSKRVFRLRWACALANLSIKGRIQASFHGNEYDKALLLAHDFNYAVLPEYIREVYKASSVAGSMGASNSSSNTNSNSNGIYNNYNTFSFFSSSGSSNNQQSRLKGTILSQLRFLNRPLLILGREAGMNRVRRLIGGAPLASYVSARGIAHDKVHSLNRVKTDAIGTGLFKFTEAAFSFADDVLPIEEEALATAAAARTSFLGGGGGSSGDGGGGGGDGSGANSGSGGYRRGSGMMQGTRSGSLSRGGVSGGSGSGGSMSGGGGGGGSGSGRGTSRSSTNTTASSFRPDSPGTRGVSFRGGSFLQSNGGMSGGSVGNNTPPNAGGGGGARASHSQSLLVGQGGGGGTNSRTSSMAGANGPNARKLSVGFAPGTIGGGGGGGAAAAGGGGGGGGQRREEGQQQQQQLPPPTWEIGVMQENGNEGNISNGRNEETNETAAADAMIFPIPE